MRLLLQAAATAGIPLIIGSCGTSGTDAGVDWVAGIARDILAAEGLDLRLATIYSSQQATDLDLDRIRPLPPAGDLDRATLESCSKIVGMMGHEPIAAALMTEPRKLVLAPREEHDAIRAGRRLQETEQWQRHYATRVGVEGTIAQGLRRCGLRRSRYIGLSKTRLQHVLTAAALDLIRTDAWLTGTPLASTRTSRFRRLRPA